MKKLFATFSTLFYIFDVINYIFEPGTRILFGESKFLKSPVPFRDLLFRDSKNISHYIS